MPELGPRPASDRSAVLSPEDFATQFEASASILWTLAAGVLADRSQVEDVLQEAAVIGLEKLDRFDPETHFAAWMGRIVRFVALNHARRTARRGTRATEPEILDREVAPDVARAAPVELREITLDDGLFDDELSSALSELKPKARACLLMKTVLELDYAEIASTLGIPAGTAMSHVHRSRRLLRERLNGTVAEPLGLAPRIVREA